MKQQTSLNKYMKQHLWDILGDLPRVDVVRLLEVAVALGGN